MADEIVNEEQGSSNRRTLIYIIIGVIAAIIGFFAAILLGLWGILYYPIKRALKNRKDKKMSLKDSNDKS